MIHINYDRQKAQDYARRWAFDRNPEFANFDAMGGDCTNFASQCIFAGCGVMNKRPIFGWFYSNLDNRSASWSGVEFLHNFLISNLSVGPYGIEVRRRDIMIGDIIQLENSEGRFYHSPVVCGFRGNEILVAAHTRDAYNYPLSNYNYAQIRYIHIQGARK